jgi:filamentous hemagglutinin
LTDAKTGGQAAEQDTKVTQAGGHAPGKLTGSLNGLTAGEKDSVHELLGRGHDIEVLPTGPSRTPDFKVEGLATELKTLSGVAKQNSDGLSSALASRIMDARGHLGRSSWTRASRSA